jgi:AbrB family looped-hinge helix DNA binding protein
VRAYDEHLIDVAIDIPKLVSIEYLAMQTVRVSPKFQVVIPKQLRERLKLRPGQDLFIYEIDGQIRLDLPHKPKNLRGLARGIRWDESDRDHAERI